MRVMIIARQEHPLPPEHLQALMEGFKAWKAQYENRFEALYFFAGQDGGMGIANVPDEATLNQITLDWPLLPFSRLEVRPLLDADTALEQWTAAAQRMAGSLAGVR